MEDYEFIDEFLDILKSLNIKIENKHNCLYLFSSSNEFGYGFRKNRNHKNRSVLICLLKIYTKYNCMINFPCIGQKSGGYIYITGYPQEIVYHDIIGEYKIPKLIPICCVYDIDLDIEQLIEHEIIRYPNYNFLRFTPSCDIKIALK